MFLRWWLPCLLSAFSWMTHSHLLKISTRGNIPQVFPKIEVAPQGTWKLQKDRHRIVYFFWLVNSRKGKFWLGHAMICPKSVQTIDISESFLLMRLCSLGDWWEAYFCCSGVHVEKVGLCLCLSIPRFLGVCAFVCAKPCWLMTVKSHQITKTCWLTSPFLMCVLIDISIYKPIFFLIRIPMMLVMSSYTGQVASPWSSDLSHGSHPIFEAMKPSRFSVLLGQSPHIQFLPNCRVL